MPAVLRKQCVLAMHWSSLSPAHQYLNSLLFMLAATTAVLLTLRTLAQRYPGGQLPLLDPLADMGIQDEQVGGQ